MSMRDTLGLARCRRKFRSGVCENEDRSNGDCRVVRKKKRCTCIDGVEAGRGREIYTNNTQAFKAFSYENCYKH